MPICHSIVSFFSLKTGHNRKTAKDGKQNMAELKMSLILTDQPSWVIRFALLFQISIGDLRRQNTALRGITVIFPWREGTKKRNR